MKDLFLVVSLPNDNPYQREQAASAQAIAERRGAKVKILYADNDAVTQSQQLLEILQSRTQRKPDAIIVEPLTTTGLERVAESAIRAETAWVVLNSDVDYVARLRKLSQVPIFAVTRDHTEIGRIQARQFAALLPGGGHVLYIQGPATSSAAMQRTSGLESTKPASIILKFLRSQWNELDAERVLSSWLQLSTNRSAPVDLVGTQYDGIARGARKAFSLTANPEERLHWTSLPFTGVDGLPSEGQAWVNDGTMAATVIAPPTTELATQLLMTALDKGSQPPERTLIELRSYPSLDALTEKGIRGKLAAAARRGS